MMIKNELKICEIKSGRDKKLDSLLELYNRNFPIEVRVDAEAFRRVLDYPNNAKSKDGDVIFHFLAAVDGAMPVGFISFDYIKTCNIGFVGYIVVEERCRGKKVGEMLFKSMKDYLADEAGRERGEALKGVLFEVERIDLAGNEEERRIRTKRVHFFERLGAKILPVDYWQPPMRQDEEGVRLHLMLHPAKGTSGITKDILRGFVDCVCDNIYMTSNEKINVKVEECRKKALESLKESQ